MASRKSKYVDYFDIGKPSKDKATCKQCGKIVSCTGRNTTKMKYHAENSHNINFNEKFDDIETPEAKKRKTEESFSSIMNSFVEKKKLTVEELVSREASKGVYFTYIAESELIHEGIRSKGYDPPKSHPTVRKYVRISAEKHRKIYRDKFQTLLGKKKRFCIIADSWTCSTKKKDYMNVILHVKGTIFYILYFISYTL